MSVSPSQLTDLLQVYIPQRFPVLITGRPGIGKSDIVESAARETDHELLISHPVVEDPTDSKGLPFPSPDGAKATFLPFGDLERALQARRPLLWFLDDLGQASPAVQAAKMQLLLARRIGEHKLPDHVTFVAATNRRGDNAGVTGVLDPVVSRFVAVVELAPTIADWTNWAVRNRVPPELIAFLRFRPDLLSVVKTSRDIEATPSPRSWGFLARAFPHLPPSLLTTGVTAAVGEAAGLDFISFLAIYRSLPSVDAILQNPDAGDIPMAANVLFALATALAAHATEDNFERVLRYAQRLTDSGNREFAALLGRDAVLRKPELQHTYAFIRAQAGELGKVMRGD